MSLKTVRFERYLRSASLALVALLLPAMHFPDRPSPAHASAAAQAEERPIQPSINLQLHPGAIRKAAGWRAPVTLAKATTNCGNKAAIGRTRTSGESLDKDRKTASIRKDSRDRRRSAGRPQTRKRAAPVHREPTDALRQGPSPPAGTFLSVLVVGDSLAVGVGMTMDSAFQGRGRVMMKKMGKISTGLDSPQFYDWNSVLKDVLDREKYDVLVIMLGANDAHNSPGSEAWGRRYESKFAELLRIPAEKNLKTLVVGLPPMRKDDFCQRVRVANEAIRNAARLYPEACAYIDSFSRFADRNGNFTDRVLWEGEWKTVRAGDGVHFTGTGYLMLSRMVADEALRRSSASADNLRHASMAALQ